MERNKKIAILAVTVSLFLLLAQGCHKSSSSYISDDNRTEENTTQIELGSEGFTGSVFSSILIQLGNGMLGKVGMEVMGDFLPILGWGGSGNSEDEQTLKHINGQLTQISDELETIESELTTILKDIAVSKDSIKNDVDWPRDAIPEITSATQELYLLGIGDKGVALKPGEGNLSKIKELSRDILGAKYDIPTQVEAIYESIVGNPTPLFNNYINKVMLELSYNDTTNLHKAYQGFEYFTSELLNHQIKGVNLVIEAYKVQDDNSSAQNYLDCYSSDKLNEDVCNTLHKEIGDMSNSHSFIYNAVSLVLRDAPLYGDDFLPTSAESIFKRAEFYRMLMMGKDHTKFGLKLYHISTSDMKKSPDVYYVAKNREKMYLCNSARQTVKGRMYDFWKDNSVKESNDYNVVEYDCGSVPNGSYEIFTSDDLSDKSIGSASVTQYDTGYENNSSGTISYGFTLLTDNTDNHFTKSSDKWSIQKPSKDNYNSSTSGSANVWPVKAYAYNKKDGYESNAHIELDGSFTYAGDEARTIYVDYHARFYTKVDAPTSNATGGGDAYSYYYVGVYNLTDNKYASSDCKNKTKYSIHASGGYKDSKHKAVTEVCSFTAEPGKTYYIYFKMIANECCNPNTVAETELDTVYRVYIKFTK